MKAADDDGNADITPYAVQNDPTPPVAEPVPPVPPFRWKTVLFFALNPLALLPVAALLASALKVPWLGSAFALNMGAVQQGVAIAVPMLSLSLVADRVIPALAEVSRASKTIVLYAMGGSLVPLRAVAASVLLSTAAAVGEELAFRGCLQVLLSRVLIWAAPLLPLPTVTYLAVLLQALIFGVLHSYTSNPAYFLTASVAGLAFGAAFASTGNIAVPMVVHFLVDVVGFIACHVQVARAPKDEQRELLMADSPIATMLRTAQQGRPDRNGRASNSASAQV